MSYWVLCCHLLNLDHSKPVTLSTKIGQLFIFLSRGKPVAVLNRCPHRSYPLLDGIESFEDLQYVVCPYHGLRYSVLAPDNELKHESSCHKLHFLNLDVVSGFVFVNLGNSSQTLHEYLGNSLPILKKFDYCIHRKVSSTSYKYQFTPQMAIENALEDLHVSSVHPTSLNKYKLSAGNYSFGPNWSLWESLITSTKYNKFIDSYAPDETPFTGYHHLFIYPYTMLSTSKGMTVSLQKYLPDPNGGCLFSYDTYCHANLSQVIADQAHDFSNTVFSEDASILSRISSSDYLKDSANHFFLRSEDRIKHYRGIINLSGDRI